MWLTVDATGLRRLLAAAAVPAVGIRRAWHAEHLSELRRDHDVAAELNPAREVGLHGIRVPARQLEELDAIEGDGQPRLDGLRALGSRPAVLDHQLVDVVTPVGATGHDPFDRERRSLRDARVDLLGHLPEDSVEHR